MTKIYARTVLRSRHAEMQDVVLSTLLVRMPRCILAEFNTHRVFSRNSASTRAIPTLKLIEQVETDPFIPFVWGANAKGMQSVSTVADPPACEYSWLKARDAAVTQARRLVSLGLHKQFAGRILEPFMWHLALVSSTEWNNFLALRDHKDAEPHMQMLAREIRGCLEDPTTIEDLRPGCWHLPFITGEDWAEADAFGRHLSDVYPNEDEPRHADEIAFEDLQKLSVARCASTSFKTVEGFDMDLERARAIYDKLVNSDPIHASPLEHVAQADDILPLTRLWKNPEQHGNFQGFRQLRFTRG